MVAFIRRRHAQGGTLKHKHHVAKYNVSLLPHQQLKHISESEFQYVLNDMQHIQMHKNQHTHPHQFLYSLLFYK